MSKIAVISTNWKDNRPKRKTWTIEKILFVLGVPYKRAALEPLRYIFEYFIPLNVFFLLISRKISCSALSRFKVRGSFNFLNLYLSLTSSITLLIHSPLFKSTTPVPSSGCVITISLLHFRYSILVS